MNLHSTTYALVSRDEVKEAAEKWTVVLAASLFALHLLLIFLRNSFPELELLRPLNGNYLSALYTPFSIILVYEVFMLILALPLSFTNSIRKQYEIISLIIIRRVFKDISKFESFDDFAQQPEVVLQIATDLGSGLLLFLLVGVFYHVSLYRRSYKRLTDAQIKTFVRLKEYVSLLLLAIFTSLTLYSLYNFGSAVYGLVFLGEAFTLDLNIIFFTEFYTVMIFSDVFIFILSFMFSQRYASLLRNAGFVSSTVILRISLSAAPEYSGWIAAAAVLTGVISQLIYVYFMRLQGDIRQEKNGSDSG